MKNATKRKKDNAESDEIPGGKQSKNTLIEMYLSSKYEFRYNTIKQCCEYISDDVSDWKQMNKLQLNSFKRELDSVNLITNTGNIREILESNYSAAVNPVMAYFAQLPAWDQQTDYIEEYINTIRVVNTKNLLPYFKKWIVSAVSNVFVENKCTNHTCLVLTGPQGKFKTTWLNLLCPPDLSPAYIYCGKPNIEDGRKMNQLISENFIINLDDTLRKINIKDENELKNYITVDYAKYDRKFDPYINEYPHLASFVGSVNGNEFLTDPTGSRRFLAFETIDINIRAAQELEIDKVYAQAFHLFKTGWQYWISQDEIDELEANNSIFQVISLEEELLQQYFYRPDNWDSAQQYLSISRILTDIEKYSGRKNISQKRLSESLKKLNYEQRQLRYTDGSRKRAYAICIREGYQQSNYDTFSGTERDSLLQEGVTTLRQSGELF